tara:strand:- start:1239 stop:1607 length:369 start_codon:yes stop_codon:yes gene_type:complete
MRFFKILLSIISTFIIFYYTNLACPSTSVINDGNYFNNNSVLGYFINHNPGYVCPLGIILGKIMLVACIIQVYYIYNNKYYTIKNINILFLIISFLLSFLNSILQQNILWAFILQLLIIFLP